MRRKINQYENDSNQTSEDENCKAQIKNILDGFTNRIDITDEKIGKFKDLVIKMI